MGTPFPPRDHTISLDDAAKLTARYRGQTRSGTPFPVVGFHAAAYERILRQAGCVGIRAYPGQHDDGSDTVVLVGVDEKGNDMVAGELAQEPIFCPPFCPDANRLTHDR